MELKNSAQKLLNQLSSLINSMSDREYTQPLAILHNASLGQHIRHTLEFFVCLKLGVETGIVNYDQREHNKAIENDRIITLSLIDSINAFLDKEHLNKTLVLALSYSEREEDPTQIKTNYYRELAYNIEHGVHHMAIIKIGAFALRPDLLLPKDFGVAASTLRYQKKQQQITS